MPEYNCIVIYSIRTILISLPETGRETCDKTHVIRPFPRCRVKSTLRDLINERSLQVRSYRRASSKNKHQSSSLIAKHHKRDLRDESSERRLTPLPCQRLGIALITRRSPLKDERLDGGGGQGEEGKEKECAGEEREHGGRV
jgi:hypothetical protein